MIKILSFSIVILSLWVIQAQAIGLGASPATIKIRPDQKTYTLTIVNTSNEPTVYELLPGKLRVKFSHNRFLLNPKERKLVNLNFARLPIGESFIGIVAKDINARTLQAQSGIKIKIKGLKTSPYLAMLYSQSFSVSLIALGVLLLGLAFGLNLGKKGL